MAATDPLALLTDGAAAWVADARARVAVTGADARAFLHRLSTNHVGDLTAGQGRLNALVTDKGRLVDLVHHLDRGDGGVLLVGSAGRGPTLLAWLDRFLFSEKVELADWSELGGCAEVAGARAPDIAERIVPGAGALAPWAFVERGDRLAVRAFDRVDANGARVSSYLVVDLERAGVVEALDAAGAARLERDDAESLRVAAGVPGEAGELTEAFNPLELALHEAIHWAKGCYIGQEVIARLDSYAKVGRKLVGLVLDDAARAHLTPGALVRVDGALVGVVTSVSPRHNGALPSALAAVAVAAQGAVEVQAAERTFAAEAVARSAAQAPHP